MKKFSRALTIMIALAVFALPLCAHAGETEAIAVRISDPVVYQDGYVIADLTGLAVQLAGAESNGVYQLFIDIFGGGENVLSAMAQYEAGAFAGYIGGMGSAYGITIEEILVELGVPQELLDMSVDDFLELIAQWELPEQLATILEEYKNSFVYGEIETREYDGVEYAFTPFTLDVTPTVLKIIKALKEDKYIGKYIDIDEADFENAEITISGGSGAAADGSTIFEVKESITIDGDTLIIEIFGLLKGEEQYFSLKMWPEGVDDDEYGSAFIDIKIVTDELGDVRANGNIEMLNVYLDGYTAENVIGEYHIYLLNENGAGDGYNIAEIELDIPNQINIKITEKISGAGKTPEFSLNEKIAIEGETAEMSLKFTGVEPTEPTTIAKGALEYVISAKEINYAVECNVLVGKQAINTDDFYIDPSQVIGALDMTDAQLEKLEAEAQAILLKTLFKLEETVPALEGLTKEIMGGGF